MFKFVRVIVLLVIVTGVGGEAGHLTGLSAPPMEDGDTKLELKLQQHVVMVNNLILL